MKVVLISIMVVFLAGPVVAKPGSSNQPISLEADTAELDQKTGTSVYQGNVVIRQGAMHMRSSMATVYTSNGKLTKVIINGKPISWTYDKPGKQAIHGTCWRAEYKPADSVIIMTGSVRVNQGGKRFSGKRAEYYLKTDVIKASGRVKLTIPPATGRK